MGKCYLWSFFGVIYPDKNNLFLLLFIENIDIDIITTTDWPPPGPDLVKANVLATELCLSFICLIGSDSGPWSLVHLHYTTYVQFPVLQIGWRISYLGEI